jgi:hypothetical protein
VFSAGFRGGLSQGENPSADGGRTWKEIEMLHRVNHFIDQVFRYADRFSPAEWTMLLVAMVLLGVLCLRGFGSRSNY